MSWQTHKTGIGAGRTSNFLPSFNPFAFLPPAASVRQADELSLTATNIPTLGIHQPHVPRERTKGLSKSDPQGVQFAARQDDRVPILRRARTSEETRIEPITQQAPSSQRKLPPINSSMIGNPLLSTGSGFKLELIDSQHSLEESEEESSTTDDDDDDEVSGVLYCMHYLGDCCKQSLYYYRICWMTQVDQVILLRVVWGLGMSLSLVLRH